MAFTSEKTGRLVSLAIGFYILGVPLFLANDPYGLRTFRIMQWLMPDPVGGNTIVWMNTWSTFFAGQPFTVLEMPCVFLCGLVLGRFLNTVASRTPPREAAIARARAWTELEHPRAAERELDGLPPDFATGPSLCIHCRRPIAPWLLTPVVGWLWQRGRSACCGRPIPVRYPAVELLTAAMFTAAAWRFGFEHLLPAALVLTGTLIALAVIDFEHLILPDVFVFPLLWYGLAANVNGAFVPLDQAVIGAISGYMVFRAFREGWFRISGRAGLGLGDCKLAAAIGAWVGPAGVLYVAILATGAALSAHCFLILIGKGSLERYFPLGPWLVGAVIFVMLFPDAVPRAFNAS